jgi:hypothetical protein
MEKISSLIPFFPSSLILYLYLIFIFLFFTFSSVLPFFSPVCLLVYCQVFVVQWDLLTNSLWLVLTGFSQPGSCLGKDGTAIANRFLAERRTLRTLKEKLAHFSNLKRKTRALSHLKRKTRALSHLKRKTRALSYLKRKARALSHLKRKTRALSYLKRKIRALSYLKRKTRAFSYLKRKNFTSFITMMYQFQKTDDLLELC